MSTEYSNFYPLSPGNTVITLNSQANANFSEEAALAKSYSPSSLLEEKNNKTVGPTFQSEQTFQNKNIIAPKKRHICPQCGKILGRYICMHILM